MEFYAIVYFMPLEDANKFEKSPYPKPLFFLFFSNKITKITVIKIICK